ncbi:MAG: VOC family protein, partial [Planctomycetota bacterium]
MTTGSTVIPTLRYRNAAAAIEWLCETFGFEKGLVVPGDGDEIAHAQLKHGEGMVMLGSATDTEFGRLMKQPDQIGGAETQTAYVVVSDADSIYERAKAAGARIAIEVRDE